MCDGAEWKMLLAISDALGTDESTAVSVKQSGLLQQTETSTPQRTHAAKQVQCSTDCKESTLALHQNHTAKHLKQQNLSFLGPDQL